MEEAAIERTIREILDRGTLGTRPVYSELKLLGHGAMGAVFRGWKESIRKEVEGK